MKQPDSVTKKGANLHSSTIERLTDIISMLEGQSFGKHLVLENRGMVCTNFAFYGARESECDKFHFRRSEEQDLANKFVKDFNEATAPIRQKFANDLRQMLANECVKLGADALEMPK